MLFPATKSVRARKPTARYKVEQVQVKKLNRPRSQKKWEIGSIRGLKTLGGILYHKVQWDGFDHTHDSWHTAENLRIDIGASVLAELVAVYNSGHTVVHNYQEKLDAGTESSGDEGTDATNVAHMQDVEVIQVLCSLSVPR